MVRNTVLAAALAAGGLALMAPAPASAGVVIGVGAGPAYGGYYGPAYQPVGWRRGGYYGYRRGYYRPYGYGYRAYRPRVGFYVAPVAPRYVRRCWINRYGYRVCR